MTAIVGSVMIMLLAKLTSSNRTLAFLGANTLIIFGLNGAYYHFINDRLAIWLLAHHSGDGAAIFTSGALVCCISIAATVPFLLLFNTFIPQLLGKPRHDGPLLPRLVP